MAEYCSRSIPKAGAAGGHRFERGGEWGVILGVSRCAYCNDIASAQHFPRAFVDSDTARAGVADSTSELRDLASRGAEDSGSNPLREGTGETSPGTAGAIPVAGAGIDGSTLRAWLGDCDPPDEETAP